MISLVEEREKRGGELVTFYNWEEGGRKGKRREKMGRRRRRIGRHARFPNYAERNYWYYFEWREMEFGGWRRNARIENRCTPRVYRGAAASFSSKLVGADRGVEKKLVAIKINYMHRNGR